MSAGPSTRLTTGQWRLIYDEKRRILLNHIRGVDIDPHAVEVARFSLLLKLIEGESAADLQEYVKRTKSRALPPLDDQSLPATRSSAVPSGPLPAAYFRRPLPKV